ncbi:MAG: hypothetical protein GY796_25315, partial [Chloroflexi bacterium]|nr:hypothetical protein [Chloroflexota bacterium]
DLRPLILDLALTQTSDHLPHIYMHLMLQPGLTGRPDELLLTLGLDPLDCHIHRTKIELA